ncbi:MAG TPA: hypothetical protein ENI26_12535 [Methylophaga aminisulfidivorans]|uniref:Toxin CptA n=2 Tax=root TaxID=1 RepID=A0A7C1W8X2_9GAMM|nr:hypothetical protein [Methylophaga aminisulfidivorans]
MNVTIHDSHYSYLYTLSIHLVTVVLLIASYHLLPWYLLVILLLLLVVNYFYVAVERSREQTQKLPLQLYLNKEHDWFIDDVYKNKIGPLKLVSSIQFPLFIMLYLSTSEDKQHLLIFRDAVSIDDWRKLRAVLRDPQLWPE